MRSMTVKVNYKWKNSTVTHVSPASGMQRNTIYLRYCLASVQLPEVSLQFMHGMKTDDLYLLYVDYYFQNPCFLL